MKKFFKRYFWTILIVIAALGLAGSAAYFSISGLSKLFAGSAMQVIIMASFIEFAKIATTAALHRYWKSMKSVPMRLFKWGLTFMVVVIMAITSSGIYGFLADAYSKTSIELDKIQGKVELIEKQQEQKKQQIAGIEEIKVTKNERVTSLIELRTVQEARLDSLYNKGWYTSAKKTQKLIDESTIELQGLQVELDSIANKINGINEEIGELDIEILELQNTDVTTEIASLKYISNVTNRPMESIANYFILAIIFVFDPLAVLLVIFANVVYDNSIGKEEEEENNSKRDRKGFLGGIRERFKKKREPEGEVVESIKEEQPQEESEPPKNNYKKFVDAINNSDDTIVDFTYDFPEEKGEEVVEYVEDDNGDFEKSNEPVKNISSLIKGIDSNPIYLQLLDVLFEDGAKNVGDVIPPYKVLVKSIKDRGIDCEDRVIKNFLTICNLLEITNMKNKDSVKIVKDYAMSKGIISLVSK
jgi:hypothetical protein